MTPPFEAKGVLQVRRAHRGIAGLIAGLIMLPPEGDAVEARLSVRPDGQCVRWIRQFDTMKAESLQTFSGQTYIEEAGPFRMAFRLESVGTLVAHVQTGTRLFGVPVPKFCGPTVEGLMSECSDDRSWTLAVKISHCWFGVICSYDGVMHIQ